MVIEYNSSEKFALLAPVLEDYAQWFGEVAVAVAYINEKKSIPLISPPKSFEGWMVHAQKDETISPSILENLSKTYEDMMNIGLSLLSQLQLKQKPSEHSFIEFKNIYAAFITRIRRLEMDSAVDGSGLDEKTGLRNTKTIESDMKREIDRLSRQGSPFSLVMARIDKFAAQKSQDIALKIAVRSIKKCMRSFDDAYYLNNGHFLISLKHSDFSGAQAAVLRLRDYLKDDDDNNETPQMTMSYCLSEPYIEEGVADLLQQMQNDLNDNADTENIELKLVEVNSIHKYLDSLN